MGTPPVRSVPYRVARSWGRRFSQAHHYASRQLPQFVTDLPSGAAGTSRTSALEKWEPAAADGDQSPEQIQEKEERK